MNRQFSVLCIAAWLCFTGSQSIASDAPKEADGRSFQVAGDPLPRVENKAPVAIPGLTTQYRSVLVDGVRLRAMVSYPLGEKRRLKPLFFTQWVSCSSLEYNPRSGDLRILAELARRSGLAVVLLERSGSGDSEGDSCETLDYNTELAHYRKGFLSLLKSGDFDTSAIFIYGSSLGATTAPLLAEYLQKQGYTIGGMVVQGGGALSHFERMLNFDRIYLERRPADVEIASIQPQMYDRVQFQVEYLIKGRHPDDIAKDSKTMAAVRNDTLGLSDTTHYGRPFSWHQQAAKHNFLAAWAQINAPALVIFNGFDQYETRKGHALIVDTANRLRPGSARLIEQDGLGHSHYAYPSIIDAYAGKKGKPAWRTTASSILDWLKTVTKSG